MTTTIAREESSNSMYEAFIGILTIMSLVVMVWLLFAPPGPIDDVLWGFDTILCLIFIGDFVKRFINAPSKTGYLFRGFGIFDLLGSIPSVPALRALRFFRVLRVVRFLREQSPAELARDFVRHRAEAALYLIVLLALLVLSLGSIAVLYFEPYAESGNIKTGQDAFWWTWVTITTVGYGDRFPVTPAGRIVGMLTMAVGIGIFGVFTSYISNLLLAPRKEDTPTATVEPSGPGRSEGPTATDAAALAGEIAALRSELAQLRSALRPDAPSTTG
jgi:voltage-gated potassium channel